MENCFRFLINVDQCLNMSYFDIFFYKLKSQHKFHLNNVQMFGDCADTTMRSAVTDIRLYLDKYPYHVGNFQIIVAMRSTFCPVPRAWEESMLYRLLQLDYELRRSRIFINSREQVQKALNLIMLYDADFSADLPELEPYKDSPRLEQDCALLLSQVIPADSPQTLEQLQQHLVNAPAGSAAELLTAFADTLARESERLLQMAAHLEADSFPNDSEEDRQPDSLSRKLARFVKDQLFNFQIFEAQIDRNNRRQNILALLRVTEFINASTESPVVEKGARSSLSQRCADNWNRIWYDPDLEERYAAMLQDYRFRLNTAARELERPSFSNPDARTLPTEDIPRDNAIVCTEGFFADEEDRDSQTDLRKILADFVDHKFSLRSLKSDWDETYRRCRVLLDQMDYALRGYAENLSRQYSAALEGRKQEFVQQRSDFFAADANTDKDRLRLEHERNQRLTQLKSPQMTPSLSFQDQLNMENALEQGNLTVRFYIRCLSAIRVASFLLLVLVCCAVPFVHYTLLQPYVFQSADQAMYYFIYLAAAAVLMLLCWTMPYNHFRRKLRQRLQALQADAEKYITGYYTKAEHFRTYINLLNQLDYITRRYRLLTQAYEASQRLCKGYLWHKVQVCNHLDKLRFFQGLIDLGAPPSDDPGDQVIPTIDGDRVSDVIDSQIYWPQR